MNDHYIVYSKDIFGETDKLFLISDYEEQVMEVFNAMFPDNQFSSILNYSVNR